MGIVGNLVTWHLGKSINGPSLVDAIKDAGGIPPMMYAVFGGSIGMWRDVWTTFVVDLVECVLHNRGTILVIFPALSLFSPIVSRLRDVPGLDESPCRYLGDEIIVVHHCNRSVSEHLRNFTVATQLFA